MMAGQQSGWSITVLSVRMKWGLIKMTDKEIDIKANEYANKQEYAFIAPGGNVDIYDDLVSAYTAGAKAQSNKPYKERLFELLNDITKVVEEMTEQSAWTACHVTPTNEPTDKDYYTIWARNMLSLSWFDGEATGE